jgi:hypothetical protein
LDHRTRHRAARTSGDAACKALMDSREKGFVPMSNIPVSNNSEPPRTGSLLQPWARPHPRPENQFGKIGIGAVAAALAVTRAAGPQPQVTATAANPTRGIDDAVS